MKKCFIVCWYGKFPYWFNIWERSCELNYDYDFFIITDQKYKTRVNNIKIINMSMDSINKLIKSKLKIEFQIKNPYKFCDYKPTYGLLFEEMIKDYDFWGHCDIDLIFGKISNFISDEDLSKYEMINRLGHFCLYRNNEKLNKLFMKDGGKFTYKEALGNKESYAFDEYTGMNLIVKNNNIKIKYIKQFADLYTKNKRYKVVGHKNYRNQAFLWESGILNRVFEDGNTIKREEFMYMHFQKKKPNVLVKDNLFDKLIIGSEYFNYVDEPVDANIIKQCNPYNGKLYEAIENINGKIKKIVRVVKYSNAQKKIWIKQKI